MKQKHNPELIETRSAPIREVRIATADDGTHTVSGYAIVFNSESVDLGGWTEFIAPGSLNRTLVENPDVLCLRDHKSELLLGRTTSQTLALSADDKGLYFVCTLPATSSANDLAESLLRGDIDSCSFGMYVVAERWLIDDKGNDKRTITDLDLFEISIVSFPAYEATSAALRAAPIEVRTRINARRTDVDTDDTLCVCPCTNCQGGDCAACADPDCNSELCSCDNEERSRVLKQKRSELILRLHELSTSL